MVSTCWQMCHHQHHSNWFGVVSYSFLWGCDNNCNLGEGWSLLQSVFGGHVFYSSYRGLCMSTPIHGWVFSSMCQHSVGSEGHWTPSFRSFARTLHAKGVNGVILCPSNLYFETCYYDRLKFFYGKCPFKRSSPFLIWYAFHDKRKFENLMFLRGLPSFGSSFVFLDMGPSILFLVFTLFWVLWFIYDW